MERAKTLEEEEAQAAATEKTRVEEQLRIELENLEEEERIAQAAIEAANATKAAIALKKQAFLTALSGSAVSSASINPDLPADAVTTIISREGLSINPPSHHHVSTSIEIESIKNLGAMVVEEVSKDV